MNVLSLNSANGYIIIKYSAPIYVESVIKIINQEKKQVQCFTTNFLEGPNHALVNIEALCPGKYIVQIYFNETLAEQMVFHKN
jgi:hypothetical protein